MSHPRAHILISIAEQRLRLMQGEKCLLSAPISSAKAGLGFEDGSGKTPTGNFIIASKHGENAPEQCSFIARIPQGLWDHQNQGDGILSRILWLSGTDEANANTHSRYIYIHGTNRQDRLGQTASCGCIRMSPRDICQLYPLCPLGMSVSICG